MLGYLTLQDRQLQEISHLAFQICVLLVLFGGICSGLSMALLSQESLHLEVLSKSAFRVAFRGR